MSVIGAIENEFLGGLWRTEYDLDLRRFNTNLGTAPGAKVLGTKTWTLTNAAPGSYLDSLTLSPGVGLVLDLSTLNSSWDPSDPTAYPYLTIPVTQLLPDYELTDWISFEALVSYAGLTNNTELVGIGMHNDDVDKCGTISVGRAAGSDSIVGAWLRGAAISSYNEAIPGGKKENWLVARYRPNILQNYCGDFTETAEVEDFPLDSRLEHFCTHANNIVNMSFPLIGHTKNGILLSMWAQSGNALGTGIARIGRIRLRRLVSSTHWRV